MRYINRGRGTGKTAMLISASYITGMPIVVKTETKRDYIDKLSKKMGCFIDVYTVNEIKTMGFIHGEKVLIDEGTDIIADALDSYLGCKVVACTMSIPVEGSEDEDIR